MKHSYSEKELYRINKRTEYKSTYDLYREIWQKMIEQVHEPDSGDSELYLYVDVKKWEDSHDYWVENDIIDLRYFYKLANLYWNIEPDYQEFVNSFYFELSDEYRVEEPFGYKQTLRLSISKSYLIKLLVLEREMLLEQIKSKNTEENFVKTNAENRNGKKE